MPNFSEAWRLIALAEGALAEGRFDDAFRIARVADALLDHYRGN